MDPNPAPPQALEGPYTLVAQQEDPGATLRLWRHNATRAYHLRASLSDPSGAAHENEELSAHLQIDEANVNALSLPVCWQGEFQFGTASYPVDGPGHTITGWFRQGASGDYHWVRYTVADTYTEVARQEDPGVTLRLYRRDATGAYHLNATLSDPSGASHDNQELAAHLQVDEANLTPLSLQADWQREYQLNTEPVVVDGPGHIITGWFRQGASGDYHWVRYTT